MKIIVPLNCNTVFALKESLSQIDGRVDIVEIWLDQIFQEFAANPMLALEIKRNLQHIQNTHGVQFTAVCKTSAENGRFGGDVFERQKILFQFLKLGGDFIDLDISQNPPEIINQIPNEKLWLSFHNFKDANLENIKTQYKAMKKFTPFLYKFAVTPKNKKELEDFINFAKNFSEQGIFTTMGALGSQGRDNLVNLTWGGFYALNEESKTADGQPTLSNL